MADEVWAELVAGVENPGTAPGDDAEAPMSGFVTVYEYSDLLTSDPCLVSVRISRDDPAVLGISSLFKR